MTEPSTSPPRTDAPVAGPAVARVTALRTFPVKSLDGEPLRQVQVLASGLEHDRAWAVVDAGGQVVTGRRAPALKKVRAALDQAPADGPSVVLPDGEGRPVRGSSADAVLSGVVGEPVRVRAAQGAGVGFNEVAAVHLVSRQAVAAAGTPAAGGDGEGCDVEDPRANVVIDLADGQDLETTWVGRQVRLGEAVLRITQTPKHCLGVYAEVLRPGRVAVDDEVRVAED